MDKVSSGTGPITIVFGLKMGSLVRGGERSVDCSSITSSCTSYVGKLSEGLATEGYRLFCVSIGPYGATVGSAQGRSRVHKFGGELERELGKGFA